MTGVVHWGAQQLREATPFGEGPRFLIRDNDDKLGPAFARGADGKGQPDRPEFDIEARRSR
jgi:hypothetical protein